MDKLLPWLLGVIATIAISAAGWSLKKQVELETRLAVIQQRLDAANTRRDDEQDRKIRQHWKLLSWQERQINTLRVKAGLEVATDKPDLGN